MENLRNRVNGDFMSPTMCIVNSGVVGVFMGNEILKNENKVNLEGCSSDCAFAASYRRLDVTSVRILSFAVKHFPVQVNVVVIDGIIKSDCDHLRNIFSR